MLNASHFATKLFKVNVMKKIAIAVLLSVVAVPAVAGGYVGVRAGQAKTNIDNAVLTKDSPTAWGVFGGYAFNSVIAVEAEYLNLGEVTGVAGGLESRGYSLSGVGSLPFNDQFSLFGKLGYAMISSKVNSPVPSPDADSKAVTYGFGGQFNVTPSVGVRLGWDKYNVDDSSLSLKGNVSLVSVGAVFKF